MKKILILHTNGMGDFLMFTPALKELIDEYPDVEIDFYITNKNVKEIISYYPNIRRIYTSSLNKLEIVYKLIEIRKNNYDCAFATTGGKTWKTNLFFLFINAKVKIGEYIRIKSIIFKKNIKRREDTHFVENNLRIIGTFIDIKRKTDFKLWFPLHFEKTLQKKIVIGIHPGCQLAYKNRRWNKFEALVEVILATYEDAIIKIFIGNEDEEMSLKFHKGIELIKDRNIKEVAYELSTCHIFINSDSGLGHLYTCFNSRIISIFGPNQLGLNQELRTGPYSKDRRILKIRGEMEEYYSKYAENGVLQCLEDIKVEDVIRELNEILVKKKKK